MLAAGWAIIWRAGLEEPLDSDGNSGWAGQGVKVAPKSPGQPDQHHNEQEGKPTRIGRHGRPHSIISGQSGSCPKDKEEPRGLSRGSNWEEELSTTDRGSTGLVKESIALFHAQKADGSLAEVLITLGQLLRAQGDGAAAYTALTEALQFARAVGPRLMVTAALEGVASVVVEQGQAELAAQLLAAASALRAQMGTPVRSVDQRAVDQALATAQSILGDDAFAAVWAEAQALPLEQILSTIRGMAAFNVLGARSV